MIPTPRLETVASYPYELQSNLVYGRIEPAGGLRSAVSARSPSEQYRPSRGWTGLCRSCPASIFRSFRNDSSATLFQISRTVLHCFLRINSIPGFPVLGLVFDSLVPHFQVICFSFRICSSILLTSFLGSSSSQRPNFVT